MLFRSVSCAHPTVVVGPAGPVATPAGESQLLPVTVPAGASELRYAVVGDGPAVLSWDEGVL